MQLLQGDPIKISILALGGQGGGVLLDWIVKMAQARDWSVQATSVAGVAQRTGATIYYIELLPAQANANADSGQAKKEPILALVPVPGDVDIVIAAELMEAGRALQRGFVTPQQTTLIASTHRVYAVAEKMVLGQGTADSKRVLELIQEQSKHLIAHDMHALAREHHSLISASLFGALAASKALPFQYQDYEQTIQQSGGVGIEASLAAFKASYDLASRSQQEAATAEAVEGSEATAAQANQPTVETEQSFITKPRELPQLAASAPLQVLLEAIRSQFPRPCWDILGEGLARVLDYQNTAYGQEYLNRMAECLRLEQELAFKQEGASKTEAANYLFTQTAAHWLAVAMSYDDMPRVADLKTRLARHTRMHQELKVPAQQVNNPSQPVVLESLEYFHPRFEEITSLLPMRLGLYLESKPALRRWFDRHLNKGRRIQSTSIRGYCLLRLVASFKHIRRFSLRHYREKKHWEQWLSQAESLLPENYDLALEWLRCRQLIKGYSDTHEHSVSGFSALGEAIPKLQAHGEQAAEQLKALRAAALKDRTALAAALASLKG